jgi:hypothetical protein
MESMNIRNTWCGVALNVTSKLENVLRGNDELMNDLSTLRGLIESRGMMDELIFKTDMKERRKQNRKESKVVLPWCGKIIAEHCSSIVPNHGLFTQCTRKKASDSQYCTQCLSKLQADGSETPKLGTVFTRNAADYTGNGKKPVHYRKIMDKLGISQETALAAARVLGWEIPAAQFERILDEPKAGRKKKEKTVNGVAEDAEGAEAKKRGRPAKDKAPNAVNEIINELDGVADQVDASEVAVTEASEVAVTEVSEVAVNDLEEETYDDDDGDLEAIEYNGTTYLKDSKGKMYLNDEDQTETDFTYYSHTVKGVTTLYLVRDDEVFAWENPHNKVGKMVDGKFKKKAQRNK